MSRMPTTVRVGPFDYELGFVEKIPSDTPDSTTWGICDRAELEIQILQGLAPQRTAEVVIHEILHACWDAAGLQHSEEYNEEDTVSALGLQVVQVMRDNPQLFSWLSKQLKQ